MKIISYLDQKTLKHIAKNSKHHLKKEVIIMNNTNFYKHLLIYLMEYNINKIQKLFMATTFQI